MKAFDLEAAKRGAAVCILHHFQKWRRGGRGKQPNPTIIGDAIDRAIQTLRRGTKDVPKF